MMNASMPTIEFRQVEPMLRSALESGVEVDEILRLLGLPDGMDRTAPDTPLPLVDYYRIQRDIARLLDDLTAQLSERKLIYKTGSFMVAQVQQVRTLQDAIASLADYSNMVHGDSYNSVRQSQEFVTLVVDDSAFPYRFRQDDELTHFIGDCLLIKVHCLLDSLTNGVASKALRKVRLRRSRGSEGVGQLGYWRAPLQYGHGVYELVFDYPMASLPIPAMAGVDLSADGVFARVINQLEQRTSEHGHRTFKARTLELVAGGMHQQGDVAKRLGVSTATLRRRLSEEAVSFRGLIHQARFEQAERMLRKGQSVSQVSEHLDYSDIRAFNRAFKNWKGQTPAAFARKVRDQA